MIDFNYITGPNTAYYEEKEVLLFQGKYDATVAIYENEGNSSLKISPIINKQDKSEILKLMIPSNKDRIFSERKKDSCFCFTVDELAKLCKDLNISITKGKNKMYYIEKLIEYNINKL